MAIQGRRKAAGGRRVVIVGVASHWGAELARLLERDPDVSAIIGIDTREPSLELDRTEFVEADIRKPVISRLLPTLDPEVLVHCGIIWYPEEDKPARALHDINVIGTLQLLAACEKAPTLKAIVARGSAAIYGSEAAAPSFFTEDMARRNPLKTRFQRDIGELESYFENFARRHKKIDCCMLRFQPEIGPDLDQPLARYLSLPVIPTQLGFDPRLQLLHETDATGALAAAVRNPVRGPVNVAPDGAISLSRIIRLSGRPAVPMPMRLTRSVFGQLGRSLGSADLYNDGLRLLRYGRGCDNTRLKEEVGYQPRYNAEEAIRDFIAKSTRGRRLVPSLHPRTVADWAAESKDRVSEAAESDDSIPGAPVSRDIK